MKQAVKNNTEQEEVKKNDYEAVQEGICLTDIEDSEDFFAESMTLKEKK